jgi:hypothetical protein
MNTSQQQQLSQWPAGTVTHACHVIRPAGTTDGFPTVQQSKRLVGLPHHTRHFCLSVFNSSGRSEGETVRVWGALGSYNVNARQFVAMVTRNSIAVA